MSKYKVKHTSILHNGDLYKEGSIIELDEKHAAKLADFIERLPNQTTAKPKTQTQNKTQTTKTNTKQKTETPNTSKDDKGSEQDGGIDNDK
jgi:hypothetical protein